MREAAAGQELIARAVDYLDDWVCAGLSLELAAEEKVAVVAAGATGVVDVDLNTVVSAVVLEMAPEESVVVGVQVAIDGIRWLHVKLAASGRTTATDHHPVEVVILKAVAHHKAAASMR